MIWNKIKITFSSRDKWRLFKMASIAKKQTITFCVRILLSMRKEIFRHTIRSLKELGISNKVCSRKLQLLKKKKLIEFCKNKWFLPERYLLMSQDLHILPSGYHRCLKRWTKKFQEEHLQPTRRLGADGTIVQSYFTSQGLLLPILWKCYWYLLFERRLIPFI